MALNLDETEFEKIVDQLKDANSFNEVLGLMSDLVLAKIDPLKQVSKVKATSSPSEASSIKSKKPVPVRNQEARSMPPRSRYIAKAIRIDTWKKSNGHCTYQNPVIKHKCESKYKLQIEHQVPFAKGGTHDPKNLTLLCAHHQQVRAIQEFGLTKMARYLKDGAA